AARHGRHQRQSPGVVRVLANDLDAAGNEPCPHGHRPRALAEGLTCLRHESGARRGGDLGESCRLDPASRHGDHNRIILSDNRRDRPATSPRVERSSTAPAATTTRKVRPPPAARMTAAGSSNSPRGERGTSRQYAKMRESKRQQFMLTSWSPSSSGMAPAGGFSTIESRLLSASTSTVAKARMRSAGMLPL